MWDQISSPFILTDNGIFSITFLAKKDFFFWVMVSFERQSCAQADKFLEFKIEEIKKYLDLFILLMTVSSNISDE